MTKRYLAIVKNGWAKSDSAHQAMYEAKKIGSYTKQQFIYSYETDCGPDDFSDGVTVDNIDGNPSYDPDRVKNWNMVEKFGFRNEA